MKLTPERLAEIKRGANCGLLSDVPLLELLELLDHIRAVEAERDAWRGLWLPDEKHPNGLTVEEANAHLQWMNDRMLALTSENARLRDAVRPFAGLWEQYRDNDGMLDGEMPAGNFKAAHDALEDGK